MLSQLYKQFDFSAVEKSVGYVFRNKVDFYKLFKYFFLDIVKNMKLRLILSKHLLMPRITKIVSPDVTRLACLEQLLLFLSV